MAKQKLDYSLSAFGTHEDYLDSMVGEDEHRYIRHVKSARKLGVLKSNVAKVYTSDEFDKIKFQIAEELNPKVLSNPLYGKYFQGGDEVLQALADREHMNIIRRLSVIDHIPYGIPYTISYHIISFHCLQTIILLQFRQANGFDISGYVDFEQSLQHCTGRVHGYSDWQAIFQGRKLLKPKPTDLSFYDWHRKKCEYTDSANWRSITYFGDLKFLHKGDLRIIPVTDKPSKFQKNVVRTLVRSKNYGTVILYDHYVR